MAADLDLDRDLDLDLAGICQSVGAYGVDGAFVSF